MSSISSITKAVSGLASAQKGLQVTGQNISNANTVGYTRQQLLQHDSPYSTIGRNGGQLMQVGLGVSNTEIRQIRDALADRRIRTESSVLNYYQTLSTQTKEIEGIFDEPYGSNLGDLMSTFWSQTQKLNTTPDGVEERMSFINSAQVLVTKLNDIADGLNQQQLTINKEIIQSINKTNEIIKGIVDINEKIAESEINGDNANDYRDQRNQLLDELAAYGSVSYYESADKRVVVSFEGHEVVNKQIYATIKMASVDGNNTFDVPVWSDTNANVFKANKAVSDFNENDTGKIKALLVARGTAIVTDETTWSDVAIDDSMSADKIGNSYVIPRTLKFLNEFSAKLTDMVNKCFDGCGIGTEEGKDGVPVFVEIHAGGGMIAGNIEVNPELRQSGGYNKLGTVSMSDPTNVGDNSKVTEFLNEWGKNQDWFITTGEKAAPISKNLAITSFYNAIVTDLGAQSSQFSTNAEQKSSSVTNIENERQAMSGVSQDEEFSRMMKYQYAYNASARMITMLDGMLDTIINKM